MIRRVLEDLRWSWACAALAWGLGAGCWGGYHAAGTTARGGDAAGLRDEGVAADVAPSQPDPGPADAEVPAVEGGVPGQKASICSDGCVFNLGHQPPRTECNSVGTGCNGVCGPGCNIQCQGGADCRVTVGAGGSFECDTGSSCQIVVEDPAAVVECTNGALCTITCQSACTFRCKKSAMCHVICGGRPVTTSSEGGSCP